eukprot:CAMPEP_0197044372 /NCGR_PEP_ID=MMETSP1384-20130603/20432_1 /TAXON_ID=29189 /ORGANISM="Ammonia sp." /LENGTH=59 /DNA_ID=CAMNT_0042475817 /DNA_START=424 /DNA_END=603 /DNA_ORIENTATION=+
MARYQNNQSNAEEGDALEQDEEVIVAQDTVIEIKQIVNVPADGTSKQEAATPTQTNTLL